MTARVFSPKQVATALGVSESSVKRWVDSGRLGAAHTAGGHRKVPLSAIADFVRDTGHDLVRPDLLGMVAVTHHTSIPDAVDPLYEALADGDESACRGLVLGLYQRGETLVDIGDHLIGPAMHRIGNGWEKGELQVFQERRACKLLTATLGDVRRWLSAPPDDAPLAIAATPLRDFSEVGVRLVELVLAASGWRVIASGSGLPLEEIRDAAFRHEPRLVCVTLTHLESNPTDFVDAYNETLVDATNSANRGRTQHAIGGWALSEELRSSLRANLVGASLRELAEFSARL